MRGLLIVAMWLCGCGGKQADATAVGQILDYVTGTVWFESGSNLLDAFHPITPGPTSDATEALARAEQIFRYAVPLLTEPEIGAVKRIELRVNAPASSHFCPAITDPFKFASGEGKVHFCDGGINKIGHELGHVFQELVHPLLKAAHQSYEFRNIEEAGSELFQAFSGAHPDLPKLLYEHRRVYQGYDWEPPVEPCEKLNDLCYRHRNGRVLEHVFWLVYTGARIGSIATQTHPHLRGAQIQQDPRPDLRHVAFLRAMNQPNVVVDYTLISLVLPVLAFERTDAWTTAFCLAGLPSYRFECQDPDKDGFVTLVDNCPTISNRPADTEDDVQADRDMDGIGDICSGDRDGDGIGDAEDPCPTDHDSGADADGDGQGDACDEDADGDGRDDDGRFESGEAHPKPDNCPKDANPDQLDNDGDGIGDVCDEDRDGDGVGNGGDNCGDVANPGQENLDGDQYGNACDSDRDGDCIDDAKDRCPVTQTCPPPNRLCSPCVPPQVATNFTGLINKCVRGGIAVDPRCMIDGCPGTPLGDVIQIAHDVGGASSGLPIGIRNGTPVLMLPMMHSTARFGAVPMDCYGFLGKLQQLAASLSRQYGQCIREHQEEMDRCNPTICPP